ncbi:MAG: hypothetical protein ABIZ91_07455 [Gemmatimonadaceae bacterium]
MNVGRSFLIALSLGAASVGVAPPASAQVRASERSTMSQTSDGTTITIAAAAYQLSRRSKVFL